MKNDSDVTKYLLPLLAQQADSVERIAIGRAGLDVEVSGTDIIVEAIDDYLARLETLAEISKQYSSQGVRGPVRFSLRR